MPKAKGLVETVGAFHAPSPAYVSCEYMNERRKGMSIGLLVDMRNIVDVVGKLNNFGLCGALLGDS
ncbi:MAG: hypothetical protein ISS67_05560 [Desulfobacterales bacterium]|uniref:Uncharacterized protein n=1 Tax=Candidatus Desulfaltia bathyphila TaxID=2841697 RepID=A0A8J6N7F0_9BACT|nr:hypothetical protein [Candidatus Desulfaltia bathyphila]MBL7196357.1 hypothetical protein [Desulfobacterales bacterium]MBL7207971.1 hypothetical protein [Desulfobacterales bacterium]